MYIVKPSACVIDIEDEKNIHFIYKDDSLNKTNNDKFEIIVSKIDFEIINN